MTDGMLDLDTLLPAGRPALQQLTFTVHGQPIPQGSHKAFVIPGTRHARITDDNPQTKPWRATVAAAAREAATVLGWAMLDGPVELDVTFYLARPQGHYGTGRNSGLLKPSAPTYPALKPDGDKLLRAVADSLGSKSAGIWTDDSRVVIWTARKVYGDPRAVITVSAVR